MDSSSASYTTADRRFANQANADASLYARNRNHNGVLYQYQHRVGRPNPGTALYHYQTQQPQTQTTAAPAVVYALSYEESARVSRRAAQLFLSIASESSNY